MKTPLKLLLILIIPAFFLQSNTPRINHEKFSKEEPVIAYEGAVKILIDNKCYGCHSPEGKSDDAKEALLWDDLPTLEKTKQIAILDEIIEVLDEGTMPPEKFLAKKPEAKLTEAEVTLLRDWAETTADKLFN
ncbi:MAG: heme-binding domain-containing protein [Candidatus Cyclobacteriaceae bacterium M3_2C_046]